jgi:sigma-B regulation protein RsbU (phosphoserine phosphatase)
MYLKSKNFSTDFLLREGISKIGRKSDCDLVLASDRVSKLHAEIRVAGNYVQVRDNNSHNGTLVNHRDISGQGWVNLDLGDKLQICEYAFRTSLELQPQVNDGTCFLDLRESQTNLSHSQSVSLASLSRNAVGNKQLIALMQITHTLRNALRIDEVLQKAATILLEIFPSVERVAIGSFESGEFVPKWWKLRHDDSHSVIRISRTLIQHVVQHCEAIISNDAQSDFADAESVRQLALRSVMCAPLVATDETVRGIIHLDATRSNCFTSHDLDVLAAVATQLSLAMNFAAMHEIALHDALIRRDVESAQAIQLQYLPSKPPEIPTFDVAGFYRAARHIGGDYYDYIALPDGRHAIVLGDVVGKGVPAALTMVRLATETRTSLEVCHTASGALLRLNRRLAPNFITMLIAIVDPQSGAIHLSNAGHELPLLRRADGSVEAIGQDLIRCPIGVLDAEEYAESTIVLDIGESITLFSDGFPDAESPDLSRFGKQRLTTVVGDSFQCSQNAVMHIVTEVDRFIDSQTQFDDMCLVQIRRTAV